MVEVLFVESGCFRRGLKVVSFKAEPSLIERLDLLAGRLGVSRSELIRAGILRVLRDPPSRGELELASTVGLWDPWGVTGGCHGSDGGDVWRVRGSPGVPGSRGGGGCG